MATSDLHLQISAFDYVRDRPTMGGSLAKIATLITRARKDAANRQSACLLFDNGDTFQGTPLGDVMARKDPGAQHPIVACINHLKYDACGLGNHDFDYGLKRLGDYLSQYKCPVVCSNLASPMLPMVQKSLILNCPVTTADGRKDNLSIGVLSSLPQKTALWSRHHVRDRANFQRPLEILQVAAQQLKSNGVDLVIALAHMGFSQSDESKDAQNQIVDVAGLEAVDLVVGGHTHLRFPGPDHKNIAEADCALGMVHETPVVQPGASASDLGIIDLTLTKTVPSARWSIATAKVSLQPVEPETPQDQDVLEIANKVHQETRRHLSKPVAQLKNAMNSFFALASPSPLPDILAAAKLQMISRAVGGTKYEDMPLLSVASATLTGGFDGPDNFLHLPAGQINRHHVAGMNPYSNHVWAVKTTGAQLLDWLERSAMIFNTLKEDETNQMLVNPLVPGFRYDAIYGLTYQIDPTRLPRFDAAGQLLGNNTGRVCNPKWQNQPLREEQEFLVATTDHRAGGGGLYDPFDDTDIVVQGHAPLQEAVLEYLKAPDCHVIRSSKPWSFPEKLNCSALLLTSPEAIDHLDDISFYRPEPCGETDDGFLKLRLHL